MDRADPLTIEFVAVQGRATTIELYIGFGFFA